MEALFKIITKVAVCTAFAIVIAGALFILPPKIQNMKNLESLRNEIKRKIAYKEKEIETLKLRQQRFSTDSEFVELIARQNKLIRPNELIFVIEPK
ncbi:MAG: septum formation initiator family protein [bacterium]